MVTSSAQANDLSDHTEPSPAKRRHCESAPAEVILSAEQANGGMPHASGSNTIPVNGRTWNVCSTALGFSADEDSDASTEWRACDEAEEAASGGEESSMLSQK